MNKILTSIVFCTLFMSCDFNTKYKTNIPIKEKRWYVQFAIDTYCQDSIISALGDFNCKLLKKPLKTEITSAQVHCFEGKILILKDTIVLKKQEYKDWKTPIFYFDWNESLADSKNNSTIKQLNNSLNSYGLEVKMIDYGILEELE